MKIERFLTCVQEKLLNYPDIHFPTIKLFMDKFKDCLSKNEVQRWGLSLQLISEITLRQITIDYFVAESNIKELDKDLTKLKKSDKKK